MSVSATPQPVSTHNQEMIVDDDDDGDGDDDVDDVDDDDDGDDVDDVDDDDGGDDDMGIFTHLVMMAVVTIVSIFFRYDLL